MDPKAVEEALLANPEGPRYEIDIFWSDEDGSYVAVVPEIPGCSAWGDTYEEALAEVKVAIRGHLRVAKKYGDPVPEPDGTA